MDLPTWRPVPAAQMDRQKEWHDFQKNVKFNRPEFIVSAIVNGEQVSRTLADTGCTTYGMISEHFARKHQLERIPIRPRAINDYKGPTDDCIKEVAKISLNVGGESPRHHMVIYCPQIG